MHFLCSATFDSCYSILIIYKTSKYNFLSLKLNSSSCRVYIAVVKKKYKWVFTYDTYILNFGEANGMRETFRWILCDEEELICKD